MARKRQPQHVDRLVVRGVDSVRTEWQSLKVQACLNGGRVRSHSPLPSVEPG